MKQTHYDILHWNNFVFRYHIYNILVRCTKFVLKYLNTLNPGKTNLKPSIFLHWCVLSVRSSMWRLSPFSVQCGRYPFQVRVLPSWSWQLSGVADSYQSMVQHFTVLSSFVSSDMNPCSRNNKPLHLAGWSTCTWLRKNYFFYFSYVMPSYPSSPRVHSKSHWSHQCNIFVMEENHPLFI